MGLFKDIYCSECGAKTSALTRIKLTDGNILCSNCKQLPSYIYSFAKECYTIADYRMARQWAASSAKEFAEVFEKTDQYGNIVVDSNNGLFCVGGFEKGYTPILKFSNIIAYGFEFFPETFKEGIVSDKVKGEVHLKIIMGYPSFSYDFVLDTSAKGKAKQNFFKTKITYEEPKRMVEFQSLFDAIYEQFSPDDDERERALQFISQAKGIFMIDDLDTVTIEELDKTRETLIQTFGGSGNEDKLVMISNAYGILKEIVSRQNGIISE